MLNPTPASRLLDPQGRPYVLWDCDLNDAEFRARLADPDPQVRAALTGKLMRQAKPDDVFRYVTEADVRALWGLVLPAGPSGCGSLGCGIGRMRDSPPPQTPRFQIGAPSPEPPAPSDVSRRHSLLPSPISANTTPAQSWRDPRFRWACLLRPSAGLGAPPAGSSHRLWNVSHQQR